MVVNSDIWLLRFYLQWVHKFTHLSYSKCSIPVPNNNSLAMKIKNLPVKVSIPLAQRP